ncbi:50S ribosomal protein L6 [Patescibacteria group bacterium]|nr:50S ribosomal protein L6 [Patescibacteria group bacterium]
MSRIGKQPIELPSGVSVEVSGKVVFVRGPKGSLDKKLPDGIEVVVKNSEVKVEKKKNTLKTKALHGTLRALINNMVRGVSEGWTKELELVGTGYRAEAVGPDLVLNVGYSHSVKIQAPEGIFFKVQKTEIIIEGVDKELVGQIAAKIRAVRPPEPYKGKGIKYKDEVIRRKPGKAAKGEGATV